MLTANFDGLIGPSHNYAGLSKGNLASQNFQGKTANPKAAALQGLEKMWQVAQLGVPQYVLPPHPRPHWNTLHRLGYPRTISRLLEQLVRNEPELLYSCYSASSMWSANSATVSAAIDSQDHKTHLTIANLLSHSHRHLESVERYKLFEWIFSHPAHFTVHPPLPSLSGLKDEGAANHIYLFDGKNFGFQLFICGEGLFPESPKKYIARQTAAACRAIRRLHQLPSDRCLLWQQHPDAIDAGVFHNDVIAVGESNCLFLHQQAFLHQQPALAILNDHWCQFSNQPLHVIEVESKRLSLADAVSSYLFNSQLLVDPQGVMHLLAPFEAQENKASRAILDELPDGDHPIQKVHYVDLKESMQNGGGPACLRLRIPLTEQQQRSIRGNLLLDERLYRDLKTLISARYRDRLAAADLADPLLAEECMQIGHLINQRLGLPDWESLLQTGGFSVAP